MGRQSASEQVAAQIREAIQRLGAKAGEWLPTEAELSEQFGVSRSTVREALKRLQAIGMVESQPGRGTVVRDADPLRAYFRVAIGERPWLARQEALAELRQAIEEGMLPLVMERVTQEHLAAMEEAVAGCWDHLDDPEGFIEYDLRFHATLYRATRNEL